MNSKYAIVTPVKNEIINIDSLFDSMEHQSLLVHAWVIVENDSTDGTKEYIKKRAENSIIKSIKIINMEFEQKEYQLGFKYSTIVNEGFNYLKAQEYYKDIEYIGILDADSFPEPDYFKKIIYFMKADPKIGICSGVLLLANGKRESRNPKNIRGSGRLWQKKCFDDSGYYIGLSADSISRIKAEINGWKCLVNKEAYFYSREANSRVSFEYEGRSAYYNGFTFTYFLLKSLRYFFINPLNRIQALLGYLKSWRENAARNPDDEIIDFNKNRLRSTVRLNFNSLFCKGK